jgi:MFS family permease
VLQWSLAVSIFAIGAPFGAILGGRLADAIGRKKTLLLNAVLQLVAGVIMAMAPNMVGTCTGQHYHLRGY